MIIKWVVSSHHGGDQSLVKSTIKSERIGWFEMISLECSYVHCQLA